MPSKAYYERPHKLMEKKINTKPLNLKTVWNQCDNIWW